jgi:hypothetical protein
MDRRKLIQAACLLSIGFAQSLHAWNVAVLGGSPPVSAPAVDELDAYTSLLIRGNGFNNSTYITDNSFWPKSITVSGDAKISTTQSKFNGSSLYFDGNGDYLSIPDSDDFAFGSEDFTIEGWIYPTNANPILCSQVDSINDLWQFYAQDNNTLLWYVRSGGVTITDVEATWTPLQNTWQHLACVRLSGAVSIYVNGVKLTLTSNSGAGATVPNLSTPLNIGLKYGSIYHAGYMSDVRISKGIARYTADFTPRLTPFPNNGGVDGYISLMLPGTGANNSTLIQDHSVSRKTVTVSGDAKISTTQSKFNGSSVYLDGNGDYLDITADATLDLSSGSWAIEGWFNPDSVATLQTALMLGYDTTKRSYALLIDVGGNLIHHVSAGGQTWSYTTSTTPMVAGAWSHIAIVHEAGTSPVKLYLNGTLITSSVAIDGIFYEAGVTNIHLGAFFSGGAYSASISPFKGYISDFRISKGIARYTEAFVPPAQSLVKTPPLDSYTALLLPGAGTGTVFTDGSLTPKTITANGNVTYSATTGMFGQTSIYFDGDGDYLSLSPSSDFNFGSSDFTIEAYVYFPSTSNPAFIYSQRTDTNNRVEFYWWNDNNIFISIYSGATTLIESYCSFTPSVNTWYHLTLVRTGINFIVYVNGQAKTMIGSNVTSSAALPSLNSDVCIGGRSASYRFYGYMSDVRVSKGIARYTTNFSVPSTPFDNNLD